MKKISFIRWSPEGLGWLCPHCGTPNPDGGDKCGNCDENTRSLPSGFLTAEQLIVLRAATRHPRAA